MSSHRRHAVLVGESFSFGLKEINELHISYRGSGYAVALDKSVGSQVHSLISVSIPRQAELRAYKANKPTQKLVLL